MACVMHGVLTWLASNVALVWTTWAWLFCYPGSLCPSFSSCYRIVDINATGISTTSNAHHGIQRVLDP